MVICCGIFVLLVALKLLLPGGKIAEFNEQLSIVMEQNMDVRAVFSAVGRAFNGEEHAMREVYQAVFSPDETYEMQHASALLPEARITAMDTLRIYRHSMEGASATTETDTGEQQVSTLADVLYSDRNLPENVVLFSFTNQKTTGQRSISEK